MKESTAMIVRRTHMWPARIAALITLSVACGPVGPRPARLDASKATAIEVSTVGGVRAFCPGGDSPQLEVAVSTTDGKRLDTWSQGEGRDGKLPFNVFEYTTSWGQVDGDGFVRLPDDSIAAIGRTVTVEVRVAERPDLVGQVALTPDFGCGGNLGARGTGGSSGYGGDHGHEGRAGAAGSRDHHGGDGERGGGGGPGDDGGPGGPGPRVEAALAMVDAPTGQRFAVLRTWANGGTSTVVFDPAGERWGVLALGGSGGNGGSGGGGGRGGTGGHGWRPSSSSSDADAQPERGTDGGNGGDGGPGGDGGQGGDGGTGGSVELIYDARFPELADRVYLDTRGGGGGSAGWAGRGSSGGSGGDGERRGRDGRSGHDGRTGTAGRDGGPGARPVATPGDIGTLFADLADRGLTLARP
jgi:hypothetical protein